MKTWLTMLLMAFLTAAQVQYDSLSLESACAAMRAEANSDVVVLHQETQSLGYEAAFAPVWMRGQWMETEAGLRSLRVDASADAQSFSGALQRAARRMVHARKDPQ